MRRNQWIAIAAAAAVLIVAVIVILAFTLTGDDEPRRTAVVVEEEPQPDGTGEPARPAERGAGEQPSDTGTQQTRPAPGTSVDVDAGQQRQQTKKPGTTQQGTRPSDQQRQNQGRPAGEQTVQQRLDAITSGRNNRPAMVEFGADWCPPCKRMKPIVSELEQQYGDRVDILYVDVDKHPQLAERHNISAIPVQIFYNRQGRQVERHEGFYPKEDIVKQFQDMGVRSQ